MPSNRPLLKAVKSGKIGKLERELLHASSSADLNEAVTEAAKLRHADMVLALLRSGASVHGEHTDAQPAGTTKVLAKNEKDKALFKKVGGLDAEISEMAPGGTGLLLFEQNDPRARMTPLGEAMLNFDVEVARILLENGASPDVFGCGFPQTLLLAVVENARGRSAGSQGRMTQIFELLCAHGANIDAIAPHDKSPVVVHVAQYGYHGMLRSLLKRGVNLDATNIGDCDALVVACDGTQGATLETVEMLIYAGAKLEPPGAIKVERVIKRGYAIPESLLRWKGKTEHAELIRYIIDGGGDAATGMIVGAEALAKRRALFDEFMRSREFARGCVVSLQSLKAEAYNGMQGNIDGPFVAGRFAVRLSVDDGESVKETKLKVKLVNLTAVPHVARGLNVINRKPKVGPLLPEGGLPELDSRAPVEKNVGRGLVGSDSYARPPKVCMACGTIKPAFMCACGMALYCDRACQAMHFVTSHKYTCDFFYQKGQRGASVEDRGREAKPSSAS